MSESWKKFRYFASFDFELEETAYQPLLGVFISHGKDQQLIKMLIDSGAHHTILNADFAEILNIDLTKCKTTQVGGITGSSIGYIHPVDLRIEKFKEPFIVNAIFVKDIGVAGLLGQADFFRQFLVKFDGNRNFFYLMRVPKLKF